MRCRSVGLGGDGQRRRGRRWRRGRRAPIARRGARITVDALRTARGWPGSRSGNRHAELFHTRRLWARQRGGGLVLERRADGSGGGTGSRRAGGIGYAWTGPGERSEARPPTDWTRAAGDDQRGDPGFEPLGTRHRPPTIGCCAASAATATGSRPERRPTRDPGLRRASLELSSWLSGANEHAFRVDRELDLAARPQRLGRAQLPHLPGVSRYGETICRRPDRDDRRSASFAASVRRARRPGANRPPATSISTC